MLNVLDKVNETFLSLLLGDTAPMLFSKNQPISAAAAADKHIAMIAPFLTLSALFWTSNEVHRRGNETFPAHRGHQELLYLVNEMCCQGWVPRL